MREIWEGKRDFAEFNGFAIEFGERVEENYRVGHHTLRRSAASHRNMV